MELRPPEDTNELTGSLAYKVWLYCCLLPLIGRVIAPFNFFLIIPHFSYICQVMNFYGHRRGEWGYVENKERVNETLYDLIVPIINLNSMW